MIDYISFGQKKANNDEAILTAIVASIGIIMYISEALCYLSFFLFLYKHNNGLSILPAEVKKSRNHSNAQTMMGQFYLFISETLYMVLLFLIFALRVEKHNSNAKDIGAVYKELEFGLVSVIQCLMIPELRNVIVMYIKGQSYFEVAILLVSKHLCNYKSLKMLISVIIFLVFWESLMDVC